MVFTSAIIYLLAISSIAGRGHGSSQPGAESPVANTKFSDGAASTPRTAGLSTENAKITILKPRRISTDYLERIWTLSSGLPHPAHGVLSIVAVTINMIITFMVVDMVYRNPVFYQSHDLSFARIGYVSDKDAKVFMREPRPAQIPVQLSYREWGTGMRGVWKAAGQVRDLSNSTDFTHTFTIHGLVPSTQYQWALSNNYNGSFTTAPKPSTSKLSFLTSSCIKPRFPYSPLAHPLEFRGLQRVAAVLPSLEASFMLFLGDFIYVDVPRRFGYSAETYRREYRQVYASPDWPAASASLPWLYVLDDHEIANDWDANTTEPWPSAIDPWYNYHALPNPPPVRPDATYFTFTHGPASFFMMDTRRFRSSSTGLPSDHPNKTMLGETQLADLLHFISRNEPPGVHFKIVVSSIPFTRNWRVKALDTWGGYLYERSIILEAMWDVSLSRSPIGIVVLSGDRHEFAATAFPPPSNGKWPLSATVHEFSTSPLNMFYLPTRTYHEQGGEDEVCIKYVPDGNSKFGVIEIEGLPGGEQGVLRYRLFIDGLEKWSYSLNTPPAVAGGTRGQDAVWG